MECPRCGGEGYLERRKVEGHVYLYCVHQKSEMGKRRKWRCYLGAEKYDYVERFNPLDLAGLYDKERFMRYMKRLLDSLEPNQLKWLEEALHHKIVGINNPTIKDSDRDSDIEP